MYSQPSWVVTHRPEIIAQGDPVLTGRRTRVLPIRLEWMLVEFGVNGHFVCVRRRRT